MRSKLVVAFFGLACVLLACEQIIGLDHFKKCDVEIDCEPIDASDASFDAGDASFDASDAFAFPDGVSEASSWARWRMDNTPIEVANGAPDASKTAFDASVSMELLDTVSGLRWSLLAVAKPNVTEASAYCVGLGYRLPTRIEVVTLLDSTQTKQPFVTPAFVSILQPFNGLWSSSYVRPISDAGLMFWMADLTNGDMTQAAPVNTGVLCVR